MRVVRQACGCVTFCRLQSHAKRRMEQVQRLERQREELEEAVIGMKVRPALSAHDHSLQSTQ